MQHLSVDWHQGLFLRPHHFQSWERHWTELVTTAREWDFPFNYGLHALEYSPEALINYQFEVRRLHARMRDGTLVAFGTGDEPDRVDLRAAFDKTATVDILLAVPRMKLGRPNVQDDHAAGETRYLRAVAEVQDENRSGQEQPIQFRRLNARLLLSTQDQSGYEVLPIARIKRASDAGAQPQIDADYIPPVLATDAWTGLGRDVVRAIYDIIGGKITVLAEQVRERSIGFAATDSGDLNRMMMLQELNGAYSSLAALAFSGGFHPAPAYAMLCQVAGRLAIFSEKRRPDDTPAYDHENLGYIFHLLKNRIQTLISTVREAEYEQRFFIGVGMGMQVTLEARWFHADWQWYIGVNKGVLSEQECRDLLAPGELDWKLGSSRQVEILFKRRAEGLQLRTVDRVVRAMPNRPDWIYYQVDKRDNPAWRDVQETQTLAMRFKDSLIMNRDKFQGNRTVVVQARGRSVELEFALFAVPTRT